MYQLDSLKVGDQRLKIIQEMAASWHKLATFLEFEDAIVQTIQRDKLGSCEECCRETLRRWLREEACRPVTWERLIVALDDAEKGELAEQLQNHLVKKI